jgi:hypothetical protein
METGKEFRLLTISTVKLFSFLLIIITITILHFWWAKKIEFNPTQKTLRYKNKKTKNKILKLVTEEEEFFVFGGLNLFHTRK